MKTTFGIPRPVFWTLLAAVLFSLSPFVVRYAMRPRVAYSTRLAVFVQGLTGQEIYRIPAEATSKGFPIICSKEPIVRKVGDKWEITFK